MGYYKKIVKERLAAITKSGRTLKDVYNVLVSRNGDFAYERLIDGEIEAVTYRAHDLEIRAFAAYIKQQYP
ncbi:MAG: hypothetical protein LBN11_04305, partial [Tannerella sp.]|nr:hypothetical protein [Tannerella sp.]